MRESGFLFPSLEKFPVAVSASIIWATRIGRDGSDPVQLGTSSEEIALSTSIQ
ncbi:MAG: hypothetical protein ABIQ65_18460 [Thermoanaerobaculia bacterium]